MKTIFPLRRAFFVLGICLAAGALHLTPAYAQDDDDDGGVVMDANLQWNLVDTMWNRREYDDAAALMTAFADANPDDTRALEALWRTYEIYRAYRPNPERKKKAFANALEAIERETRKYGTTNKERAAHALWYNVHLLNNEGNRAMAIEKLQELVKRFPGTQWDDDAYWHLAEWLREAGRYREAIPAYESYGKIAGNSQGGANAAYRIGWMYQELKDKENSVKAFTEAVNGPFNWGWGEMHWAALDAARRVKAQGDDEAMRAIAAKIMEKADKNWVDYLNQVRTLIGEKTVLVSGAKRITVYPHLNYYYYTDKVNIDGRTKLSLGQDIPVLVRQQYYNKEQPFKGTISITPQMEMAKVPDDMKKGQVGGKDSFTSEIAIPDANGGVNGDFWYRFTAAEQQQTAPDNLVVTRKWTKSGDGWGECTIRIQSSAKWHMWIYLPNNRTNTNNLNFQPNEVQDGGKTFKWHDWFDMNQGLTIKFPVEIGANIEEFYPKIRLEHGAWHRNPERSGEGKEAAYDFSQFKVSLKSEESFPYTVSFPGNTVVTIAEVTR